MTPALVDCTVRFRGPGDYRYSATFRVGTRDVRVRLCRDDDLGTAFAVAEALDEALRWTRLVKGDPPPTRHLHAGHGGVGGLERFACELAAFAQLVPIRGKAAL